MILVGDIITDVIILLMLHYIADFILQSNTMATRKSTSNKWLGIHVGVYSSVFVLVSPLYAIINGVIHFMVDYVSSRVASHFRKREEWHNFFMIIGLDQLIHIVTLIMTYEMLFVR